MTKNKIDALGRAIFATVIVSAAVILVPPVNILNGAFCGIAVCVLGLGWHDFFTCRI
jgi:hypothetical protein